MPVFSRVRSVLFDAVGTLFMPDPPVVLAYQAAGKSLGIDLPAELIAPRFRAAYRLHFDGRGSPTSETHERAKWRSVIADVFLDPHQTDDLLAHLWQHFARPQSWRLADDASHCWQVLLARGYEVGIASNFDSRLQPICAGHALPISGDRVFVSTEIGFAKPDLRFFLTVAERLQRQPGELLLVGDDPIHDVHGSQAAGWEACLLDRAAATKADASQVASLGDLLEFLLGPPAD